MTRCLMHELVTLAGGRTHDKAMDLSRTFPTPAAIASAELDALAMPAWKRQALQRLARTLVDSHCSLADSEAVMQALMSIPEVSDPTLQAMALRSLSEPDALPIDDRVRCGAAALGGASLSGGELARRAESWRPWRGYAAMHLWAASIGTTIKGTPASIYLPRFIIADA